MKAKEIIIFFVSILMVLAAIALVFPNKGVEGYFHTYRFPHLDKLLNFHPEKKEVKALDRMKNIEQNMQLDDSQPMSAYDREFMQFNAKNPARIYLPHNNVHYFDRLFAQMDSCVSKGELLHVVHYGDSQIEADRITSYIRERLQSQFGGSGPGLLPVVQPIHSYTVKQRNSNNMERYLVDGTLQKVALGRRYGALAQYTSFSGNANFHIYTKMDRHNTFNNIRLFVGNTSPNFRAQLVPDNSKPLETHIIAKATPGASIINWKMRRGISAFTINVSGSGELYGVSLDAQCGIAVDNVPMRGSRGTFFTRMDQTLFSYMHQQLNTQLILLEFGGNAMPIIQTQQDVLAYRQLMDMQIRWIKQCCPQATLILLGPTDMSEKVDGQLQTRRLLEENIQCMRDIALRDGIAFWNMYDVMGGRNSMQEWVSQNPPLAMPDYTHLSNAGAEMIGKMFVESLLNYYDHYQKRSIADNKQPQRALTNKIKK